MKSVLQIMKSTLEFIECQKANGFKDITLINIKSKFDMMAQWKPVSTWKKDDPIKYIVYMRDKGYKQSYIEMTKSLIKRYFIWAEKESYVKDIIVKFPKISLKASDILTPDDINKLIEAATLPRDKALIAALFESGARISELIAIRVKDLQETPQGLKVLIPGTKTGEEYRPCLLINSAQYIRNHVIYPPLKGEDRVFNFCKQTAGRIMKNAASKAGIDKPISCHKLRHGQATYMTRKGYQESIIRSKLGWTGDSQMVSRYTHLDGDDIIAATLEKEKGGEHNINPDLIKPITPGAPIMIADPSMEFARINKENQELRAEHDKLTQKMTSQEIDFKVKMESLERKIENMNMFNTLASRSEQSLGFQTIEGAEAWEPGTGNVITYKKVRGKTAKSVRKPSEADLKPDNPLLDAVPAAPLLKEDKTRAAEFMKKQKKLIEDLHSRGGLTSTEKARKVAEKLKKEE